MYTYVDLIKYLTFIALKSKLYENNKNNSKFEISSWINSAHRLLKNMCFIYAYPPEAYKLEWVGSLCKMYYANSTPLLNMSNKKYGKR